MRSVVIAVLVVGLVAGCSASPDSLTGARSVHPRDRAASSGGAEASPAAPKGTTSQGHGGGTEGSTPSAPDAPDPVDAGAKGNGGGNGTGTGADSGTTTPPPSAPPSATGCDCGCDDPCLGALIDLCAKFPTAPGCDQVPDSCACLQDCSDGPLSCAAQLGG